MARSGAVDTVRFLGIAAAVIIGGVAVGYVVGGQHSAPTSSVAVAPTATSSPTLPAAPPAAPRPATPRPSNSDYSAPGAPRIKIVEEKTPVLASSSSSSSTSLRSKTNTNSDIPTPDVEASQENGTSTAPPASRTSPDDSSTPPADTSNPASPPTINPDGTSGHTQTDTEASQQGDTTPAVKAQFRVQTGTFVAAENARALADALRDRGYTTSTHAEQDGDKTVYKVQVGAYRTRSAADKAALDLQKSGYPAYVSPITP